MSKTTYQKTGIQHSNGSLWCLSFFQQTTKFEISNLALQLQEVICRDKSRSDVLVHDDKGMFLEVPNADARMNQHKK